MKEGQFRAVGRRRLELVVRSDVEGQRSVPPPLGSRLLRGDEVVRHEARFARRCQRLPPVRPPPSQAALSGDG